jgi:hypothetical protein
MRKGGTCFTGFFDKLNMQALQRMFFSETIAIIDDLAERERGWVVM